MPHSTLEQDWKLILSKTRPDQPIGLKKLVALCGMSYDRTIRALRHLRSEGLATLHRRAGHKDGAQVQFYKTALLPAERDNVTRGTYKRPHGGTTDEVFDVERTFNVKGGHYTARQLRRLARAVLNELGEL